MLILIEGIVVCFILLMVCVLVLKDGPEKCAVFHEEDVKKRVVELGYITEKELKKRHTLSGIGLFVPMLILVPVMVYCINGASDFWSEFWQMTAIFMIGNLFDRLFIDEFWVGHTKAWFIPGTEDLMPYIPVKVKIKKWVGNLIMFPLLSALIAGAGMKSTNKDMMDSLFFWGVAKRYKYGVGVAAVDWNGVSEKKKRVIDKATSSIAKKIKHNSGNVKPGIKTKGMFWIMHLIQRNGFNPRDVEYWKSKGWTEKKRPWK